MTLPSGMRLGRYEVRSRLGAGGMGEVYLAWDAELARQVALKVLPASLAGDSERMGRFEREARAAAALNHPAIAHVYEIRRIDGAQFIAMEFIDGATLSQKIHRDQAPLARLLRYVIQVAQGLAKAHAAGIVHRDLKPDNIMVTREGHAKILDFGLAKLAPAAPGGIEETAPPGVAQTSPGMVMGTPSYMSPEQARGAQVDARTDVWSLGVLLYEVASRALPFQGGTQMEVLARIIEREPAPLAPREDALSVRGELERIISKCLRKAQAQRYQSMSELLADLRRLREALQSGGVPSRAEAAAAHAGGGGNLPRQITSFVGRERELAELGALLAGPHRLLTITGAGGSGKTRLALEAAARKSGAFAGGVWWVDFAPLTSPQAVLHTVAEALRVKEEPERPVLDSVVAHLEGKAVLLVLDNCEHVLAESARFIEALLRATGGARVLATSREALNIAGECVWTAPTLSLPTLPAAAARESRQDSLRSAAADSDAVRLFVERAASGQPGFALTDANVEPVVQICRRLDGIPLAIELAAARIRLMSPPELRRRLDDCFRLLTGGARTALARHQTLRAAVDWSYELLTPPERRLFAWLAPFSGGFELEAAEEVCGIAAPGAEPRAGVHEDVLDGLSRLVDKSLVVCERRGEGGSVRYRLLEPLRQYAAEKLAEAGQAEAAAEAHFSCYQRLAEQAYDERIEQSSHWLERLEREHDNLRAALDWSARHDAAGELKLAGALAWFWHLHSHFSEGRQRLGRVLDRQRARTRDTARALWGASVLAVFQGDFLTGRQPAEESVAIWRELGDLKELALALEPIGFSLWFAGENQRALDCFEECLKIHREAGDLRLINRATLSICQVLVSQWDVDQVEPLAHKALALAIEHDEIRDIHNAHHYLADCALIRGDVKTAEERYGHSLRAVLAYGDRLEMTFEVEGIAMALAGQGRKAKAMRLAGACDAEREAMGAKVCIAFWETLRQRFLGATADSMDPADVERERQRGRAMGFAAAMDYALARELD